MGRHVEIHAQANKQPPKQNMLYKCHYCSKTFQTESVLLDHCRKEHPNDKASTNTFVYKCWYCPKEYQTEKFLKNHEKAVHQNVTAGESKTETHDSPGPFRCKQCGVVFVNLNTLKQH